MANGDVRREVSAWGRWHGRTAAQGALPSRHRPSGAQVLAPICRQTHLSPWQKGVVRGDSGERTERRQRGEREREEKERGERERGERERERERKRERERRERNSRQWGRLLNIVTALLTDSRTLGKVNSLKSHPFRGADLETGSLI